MCLLDSLADSADCGGLLLSTNSCTCVFMDKLLQAPLADFCGLCSPGDGSGGWEDLCVGVADMWIIMPLCGPILHPKTSQIFSHAEFSRHSSLGLVWIT
jgi:hypothetical protein